MIVGEFIRRRGSFLFNITGQPVCTIERCDAIAIKHRIAANYVSGEEIPVYDHLTDRQVGIIYQDKGTRYLHLVIDGLKYGIRYAHFIGVVSENQMAGEIIGMNRRSQTGKAQSTLAGVAA